MMVELPVLYVIFVSVSAALAIVAVWSRRRLIVRAGAVGILVLSVAISYAAFSDLLSRPKPALLEFAYDDVEQATVLAAALREGRGIYLWLRLPGVDEPRYYIMPWRQSVAEELQEAMRQAERNRSALMLRLPFEKSMEQRDAPRFYALPQPRLPDKPSEDFEQYRHPSLNI